MLKVVTNDSFALHVLSISTKASEIQESYSSYHIVMGFASIIIYAVTMGAWLNVVRTIPCLALLYVRQRAAST